MTAALIRFDPFSPDFLADPFRYYDQLLQTGTIHRTRFGVWVSVGYEECAKILADRRFLRDHRGHGRRRKEADPHNTAVAASDMTMLNCDPPRHEIMRSPFIPIFSPRNLETASNSIENNAKILIESIQNRDEFDVVSDFARPLAVKTIKSILGLEALDDDLVTRFSMANSLLLEPRSLNRNELEEAEESFKDLTRIIIENISSDLLDKDCMTRVRKSLEVGRFTEAELLANFGAIIFAAVDTTVNLICGGTRAVLDGAVAPEGLKTDLGVSEMLRLFPSIHMTGRIAGEDLAVGDCSIEQGDLLIVVIAAANRDPRVYSFPGEVDLNRKGPPPLSFGAGPHFCLGSHLAKLEARHAWNALLTVLDDYDARSIRLKFQKRAFLRAPESMVLSRR